MNRIEQRIQELGIELPQASTPGANYVPTVRSGALVFISGQVSQWNGERRFIGKLGREFQVADGQQAARLCALNLINFPAGTMLGIYGLWVLLSKETERLFDSRSIVPNP